MTRNRIWLAKMDRRGYCGRTLLLISKEILRMIRHISYRSIRFLLGTIMGLICGLVQHPGIEEALGK
jgi:hypothetical protein